MILKRVVALSLCVACVLAAVPSAHGQDELDEVDRLRQEGQFEEALERLQSLRQQEPANADVLWRLAWTRIDLGEQSNPDAAIDLFNSALEEARQAVQLAPDNARAQMVRAMAAGQVALKAGTRQKIELSREVKDAVDRAIELDDETLDGAYHIRARWNHEIASLGFFERSAVKIAYGGLPEASYEAARRDFEHAADIRDRVLHRLELGRTLLAMGETARAREQLLRAIEMEDDDPDASLHREEARRLLSQAN